jgi:hypothetical protein
MHTSKSHSTLVCFIYFDISFTDLFPFDLCFFTNFFFPHTHTHLSSLYKKKDVCFTALSPLVLFFVMITRTLQSRLYQTIRTFRSASATASCLFYPPSPTHISILLPPTQKSLYCHYSHPHARNKTRTNPTLPKIKTILSCPGYHTFFSYVCYVFFCVCVCVFFVVVVVE